MYIEMLDYSVTVPSINGLETANFFGEHPIYGTVGYPTYEDAENDLHGILGFGQFLDCVESYIANGLIGDHYVFNPQNMIVEIVNEYEGWDWTPETGIIPWESETKPEPEYPNRKQRRAIRINYNKSRKGSDRAHGKKRPISPKDIKQAERQEYRTVGSNAHIPYLWTEDYKHEYIPVRVNRGKKVPRTQTINVHKDTIPVPEQEFCIGIYETREVRKGITVTMEWDLPEAVQGEPV